MLVAGHQVVQWAHEIWKGWICCTYISHEWCCYGNAVLSVSFTVFVASKSSDLFASLKAWHVCIQITHRQMQTYTKKKSPMRCLGVDVDENTVAAFSSPVTSDVATLSSSQSFSQTWSSAEVALGKTLLIWIMCLSEMWCVLLQAEEVSRVMEGHEGWDFKW